MINKYFFFKIFFFSILITFISVISLKKFDFFSKYSAPYYNLNYKINAKSKSIQLKIDNENFPTIVYSKTMKFQANFGDLFFLILNDSLKNFFDKLYFAENDQCTIDKPSAYKNAYMEKGEGFYKSFLIEIKKQTEIVIKQCVNGLNNLINQTRREVIAIAKEEYENSINRYFLELPRQEYRGRIDLKMIDSEIAKTTKSIEQENFAEVSYDIKKSFEENNFTLTFATIIFVILIILQMFFYFLNLSKIKKKKFKKKITNFISRLN